MESHPESVSEAVTDACSVVDLFCGVGGLSHGFMQAGFDIAAGVDADPDCQYAFETNNDAHFVHARLQEMDGESIEDLFPDCCVQILVGCAPCQPFSAYVPDEKKEKLDDWQLLNDFAEIVASVKPTVVAMENVPRLRSFRDGEVLTRFEQSLRDAGYTVTREIVYCPDYGVPQTRRRLVVLGSRLGEIELIDPTHPPEEHPTVGEVIGNMPAIAHGETHPDDRIHRSSQLGERNLSRIQASRPGGTWEDWPDELVADCHKRESGSGFKNIYGRMEWDGQAPTITTGCFNFGRGRFGHPEQDRAISLREAAMLQTFPEDYEFVAPGDPVYFKHLGRYIGNAVPVALGKAIAWSLGRHLEDNDGR